jgi:hypothetical protein
MFFNNVALSVDPTALAPYTSPFANLSWDNKMAVFEQIEDATANVLAALDSELDEPFKSSLSGLVDFVPGAILEFVGFGTYSEWPMFDPGNPMTLKGRPTGWELSKYQEGRLTPVHGWDELIGYHNGVQAVSGSWDKGEGVLDDA